MLRSARTWSHKGGLERCKPTRIFIGYSGYLEKHPRMRSSKRTGSWSESTTQILTPKTPKPRSASRRFNGHTKSYLTLRSGGSTTTRFAPPLEKVLTGHVQELAEDPERRPVTP